MEAKGTARAKALWRDRTGMFKGLQRDDQDKSKVSKSACRLLRASCPVVRSLILILNSTGKIGGF